MIGDWRRSTCFALALVELWLSLPIYECAFIGLVKRPTCHSHKPQPYLPFTMQLGLHGVSAV
jgi:hypothetical protein